MPEAGPPSTPRPALRLRAGQRVRRNADFMAVRALGRRMECGAFLLTWRVRGSVPPGPTRVGVVASRAAVGDAVRRNRAKRRLRELFRRHQHALPPGLDLVLTARAVLLTADFAALDQRFAAACRKLAPSAAHE